MIGMRYVKESLSAAFCPDVPAGAWLASFDPDGRGGLGDAGWTTDPDEAMKFDDAEAALRCYRTQSCRLPFRDDGLPNRPLTAYTVLVETLPVKEER